MVIRSLAGRGRRCDVSVTGAAFFLGADRRLQPAHDLPLK